MLTRRLVAGQPRKGEAECDVTPCHAALQPLLGAGVWCRDRWVWIAGLVISSLVIVTHIFFHRRFDGWAVGGLVTNIPIIWIVVVKEEEFSGRRG